MAVLDAYADKVQFRARVGDQGGGGDTTLDEQLLLASRLLERSTGVMPGAWNTHTGTYDFDADGGTLLRLRDDADRQYFLQTVTSIGVDTEGDGTYDGETLTLALAWVKGYPANAAAGSEPFTGLELLPYLSSADLSAWPSRKRVVRIAGTFGWAAVPQGIVDLTVHLAHDVRQGHAAGPTLTAPTIDGGMGLSDQTWRLWRQIEGQYSRRIPI